jgi:hypothetical protein
MVSLRSVAVALLLALLASAPALSSRAQQDATTVLGFARLNPQSNSVTVDIRVNTSPAVSAFHFLLVFDPEVLRLRSVSVGAFLQSSGQDPVCDKTIDPGAVLVECALPNPATDAPSGLGELASLDFDPARRGDAGLMLSHVVLRGADGSVVASKVQQTNFSVAAAASSNGGSRSHTIVLVVLGGGLAALLLVAGGYLLRTRAARRAVDST